MSSLLHPKYQKIMAARDALELRAELVRAAQELEFGTVCAMTAIEHEGADAELHFVDNVPASNRQLQEQSCHEYDPVIQHCKRSRLPIVWGAKTYNQPKARRIYYVFADIGSRSGICQALHLPGRQFFVFAVDTDQDLALKSSCMTHLLAQTQLLAIHALDCASKMFLPIKSVDEKPKLLAREAEALRWTMEGKDIAEIADIFNITPDIAKLHLSLATQKLACVNEHQATLKALRLGII